MTSTEGESTSPQISCSSPDTHTESTNGSCMPQNSDQPSCSLSYRVFSDDELETYYCLQRILSLELLIPPSDKYGLISAIGHIYHENPEQPSSLYCLIGHDYKSLCQLAEALFLLVPRITTYILQQFNRNIGAHTVLDDFEDICILDTSPHCVCIEWFVTAMPEMIRKTIQPSSTQDGLDIKAMIYRAAVDNFIKLVYVKEKKPDYYRGVLNSLGARYNAAIWLATHFNFDSDETTMLRIGITSEILESVLHFASVKFKCWFVQFFNIRNKHVCTNRQYFRCSTSSSANSAVSSFYRNHRPTDMWMYKNVCIIDQPEYKGKP